MISSFYVEGPLGVIFRTHLVPVFPDCQIGPKLGPNARTLAPSLSYLLRVKQSFSASSAFTNPIDSLCYTVF